MQIDKDGAEPERVKQELSELGLLPEEWGGQTSMVPVRPSNYNQIKQKNALSHRLSHTQPFFRSTL